jgi:hypothetical protein
MTTRAQQEEYLASIAQAFDVGDFESLDPKDLRSINALIAEAWQAFKQGEDVDVWITLLEQTTGRIWINEKSTRSLLKIPT